MPHGLLQNRQRACTLVDLDGSCVSERVQALLWLYELRLGFVASPERLEAILVEWGWGTREDVQVALFWDQVSSHR